MRTTNEKVKVAGGTRRQYLAQYESWHEWISTLESDPDVGGSSHSPEYTYEKWYGTQDFAAALELSRTGWREGAENIRSLTEAMFEKLSSLVEVDRYHFADDGGISVDVGRAMDGESDYWLATEPNISEGIGRVIRMVVNVAVSCGVSTDVITARGAAMAALAELLEYAGHRVEIIMASSGEDTSGSYVKTSRIDIRVVVKRADQPLDMYTLAYALAHPSTFRRLAFAEMEAMPASYRKPLGAYPEGYGYTYPCDVLPEDTGDIYCGKALLGNVAWTRPDMATEWVLAELRSQGVKVED